MSGYLDHEPDDGDAEGAVSGPLLDKLERERERNRAELGVAGLGAASVFATALRKVTVRSAWLPPGGVTWTPQTGARARASGGGTMGRALVTALRLGVDVDTEYGDIHYAPDGAGDGERWPLVVIGAIGLGSGAAYLIWRSVRALLAERRRGAGRSA